MSEPFLKWPGGKRWLASRYSALFPTSFTRYVEPFLGGGAVFFALAPEKALLADTNAELINTYRCIKAHHSEIERRLSSLHRRHSERVYYEVRGRTPRSRINRAVRFLYLNRTCFNGLYRVNREGRFNVPIGSKTEVSYSPGFLAEVSKQLRTARFRVADFEVVLDTTKRGDFAFIDPPYTVKHNTNNFVKYNSHLFSWEDQIRLAAATKRAAKRGVKIVLSNADHERVRDLYNGFGEHTTVNRSTVLAASPSRRGATTELLVSAN